MQEVMEATQPELAAPISTQDAAASAGAMADSSPAKEMPVMILCDCADYNQVDNDWFEVFTVKSQRLSSGDKVRIVPEESFYLFTAFVEMDTYPDVGYHWTLVIITPEDYERGFVAEQEISVTENHGRYTGNTVF